jgi:hypothetical protein
MHAFIQRLRCERSGQAMRAVLLTGATGESCGLGSAVFQGAAHRACFGLRQWGGVIMAHFMSMKEEHGGGSNQGDRVHDKTVSEKRTT